MGSVRARLWTLLALSWVAWVGLVAPAAAADVGVTADTILLGQSGVVSGPVAEPTLQYLAGARLVFDAVNARGGVHGRKIKLRSYDDQFDPKLAAENTRKLLNEDRVFALFGYAGTGAITASLPQMVEKQVPLVGGLTGSDDLRDAKNRLIFHTRAGYAAETGKMLAQLKTTGITAVALVYEDDPFGRTGLKSARTSFERFGMKPVIEEPIDMKQLDALGPTADKVAQAKPQAIIMITAGKASTAFIRAYLKTGSRPQFMGVSVLSAKALFADLGADAHGIVIAQVVPSPTSTKYAVSRDFVEAARKAGNTDLTYNSLEGYVAAKVLVEALQRAGADLSRTRLIAALESLRSYDLGGFLVDFSESKRQGSHFVDLSIIDRYGRFLH